MPAGQCLWHGKPAWMVSKPTPCRGCCSPLGPQDTWFNGPISLPWHRSRLEAFPKPQHPVRVGAQSKQPHRPQQLNPGRNMRAAVSCEAHRAQLSLWGFGVYQHPVLSIAPLPFFSIASTSFTRSGGAISGGLNCSCKSGRGDPGGEGGREGLSTSSALSSRAGPGHNAGNSQQEQGKLWPPL